MSAQTAPLLPADRAGIARAAQILRAGGLVAVPTETVYGLAARADSAPAVAEIYRAKGRPDFNPLIVHVGSMAQAEMLAEIDDRARQLAAIFWPGPLTLVVPLRASAPIAPAVTAGLSTIGLRQPAHQATADLLAELDLPIAAPSANRSLGVSPTQPAHVQASLGNRVDAILDGGICSQGLESTIVALHADGAWSLLREGPICVDQLTQALGMPPSAKGEGITAPGQMARHYSPGKPVRLEAERAFDDEFLIGFGAIEGDCNLSQSGDLAQAAAQLYACLHQAADAQHPRIAIAPLPRTGIGAAINDRLQRAAA